MYTITLVTVSTECSRETFLKTCVDLTGQEPSNTFLESLVSIGQVESVAIW